MSHPLTLGRRFGPVLLALLSACAPAPDSGPVAVTWDRDACERCRMVLSDRHYAAQIRGGPPLRQAQRPVYKFDDLGCALHWLQQQPWADAADTEIWVASLRDGAWLDARQAHYLPAQTTPMDYGLGAVAGAEPGSLDFAAARAQILAKQHAHSH